MAEMTLERAVGILNHRGHNGGDVCVWTLDPLDHGIGFAVRGTGASCVRWLTTEEAIAVAERYERLSVSPDPPADSAEEDAATTKLVIERVLDGLPDDARVFIKRREPFPVACLFAKHLRALLAAAEPRPKATRRALEWLKRYDDDLGRGEVQGPPLTGVDLDAALAENDMLPLAR